MFDNIIVGLGNADGALDALALAKTLVSPQGALTLVHVEVARRKDLTRGAHAGARAARHDSLPEPLLLMGDTSEAAGRPLTVLTASSVAEGLHEYAARSGADLLAIGVSRQDRIRRILGRDDTHDILDGAPCAVAVAPGGYAGRSRALRAIGVGYDGSLASEEAVTAARALTAEHTARLSAFEAVPLIRSAQDADMIEERIAAARSRVAALGDLEPFAGYGPPAQQLAEYGATLDLLVIGPHDSRDSGHVARASVAQRLADGAPCALLVLAMPVHRLQAAAEGRRPAPHA